MLNKNKLLRIMNRVIAYLIISGLIIVGGVAGYTAMKVEEKPTRPYKFVTRSGVDSTAVYQYQQAEVKEDKPQPIRWNEITTMIVSITVAIGTVGFGKFKTKIYSEISDIKKQLHTVADQKNRDNVDHQLMKIEQDAAGFVDDERIRALIEGIGSRTRSFCRDVMAMDFTDECLDKAIMKINARIQDGNHQVKDLCFSDYFTDQINHVRADVLKQLKLDLSRLVQDKLHNSKYERFGEIICRFQRNYMRSVIRLHNENKA